MTEIATLDGHQIKQLLKYQRLVEYFKIRWKQTRNLKLNIDKNKEMPDRN